MDEKERVELYVKAIAGDDAALLKCSVLFGMMDEATCQELMALSDDDEEPIEQ